MCRHQKLFQDFTAVPPSAGPNFDAQLHQAREVFRVAQDNSRDAQENSRVAQENARVAQENSRVAQDNFRVARDRLDWLEYLER